MSEGKMTLSLADHILKNNPFATSRVERAILAAQYVLGCKSASAALRNRADRFLDDLWVEEAATVQEHNRRILVVEDARRPQ